MDKDTGEIVGSHIVYMLVSVVGQLEGIKHVFKTANRINTKNVDHEYYKTVEKAVVYIDDFVKNIGDCFNLGEAKDDK